MCCRCNVTTETRRRTDCLMGKWSDCLCLLIERGYLVSVDCWMRLLRSVVSWKRLIREQSRHWKVTTWRIKPKKKKYFWRMTNWYKSFYNHSQWLSDSCMNTIWLPQNWNINTAEQMAGLVLLRSGLIKDSLVCCVCLLLRFLRLFPFNRP